MTEYGAPFDGILTGDASVAPYSAAEWARIWKLQHGAGGIFPNYGVFYSSGDGTNGALEVRATAVISSNIEVQLGAALVDGRFYETTTVVTLAIAANASGNARIDTVILRLDYAGQTIRAAIKQGTPAASPARPTLQQDATYWEMPLADIAVANGFTVINQTDITDRRRAVHASAAGWQPIVNPPGYAAGLNYDAANLNITIVNDSVVLPMSLSGNMLVQEVQVRHITTAITYAMDWAIYFEDLNDGNPAEQTLRQVAIGGGTAAVGGTTNISLPATPAPQYLPPGAYWLALRWTGGSVGGIQIGRIVGTSFDYGNYIGLTTIAGATLPKTYNLPLGAPTASGLAIRIRGRIAGNTAAY